MQCLVHNLAEERTRVLRLPVWRYRFDHVASNLNSRGTRIGAFHGALGCRFRLAMTNSDGPSQDPISVLSWANGGASPASVQIAVFERPNLRLESLLPRHHMSQQLLFKLAYPISWLPPGQTSSKVVAPLFATTVARADVGISCLDPSAGPRIPGWQAYSPADPSTLSILGNSTTEALPGNVTEADASCAYWNELLPTYPRTFPACGNWTC